MKDWFADYVTKDIWFGNDMMQQMNEYISQDIPRQCIFHAQQFYTISSRKPAGVLQKNYLQAFSKNVESLI